MRVRVLVSAVVLAVVIALALVGAKRWLDIDRCLDSGGRWSYSRSGCDYGPGGPPQPPR